jgi:hypothetical protein
VSTEMVDVFEKIVTDVAAECERQNLQWGGKQRHPNGTSVKFKPLADAARNNCRAAADNGSNTWSHLVRELMWDALSETDRVQLREKLTRLVAAGVVWIEHLDENNA